MISEQKIFLRNGVFYLSEYSENKFEKLYVNVRQNENRIYSDMELKNLPEIKRSHPFANEWRIRRNSLDKLKTYLKNKNAFLNIMELGCGNGWLSRNIAAIENSYVIGIDLNKFELEQAARNFDKQKNLKFFYADIFADYFELGNFDIIILASSIQYFKNLNHLFERLFFLSKQNGEIHIIDSPVYNSSEIEKAKSSTKSYYKGLGFPKMTEFYFHHSFEEIKKYNPVFLYKPQKQSLIARLFRSTESPFPWIVIKKN